jgi:branched-chain amino acid transport system substrate-binding protein
MLETNYSIKWSCRLFILPVFLLIGVISFSQSVSKKTDETIKIGLLVQDNQSKEARYAAEIAVQQANAKGGIKGKPVKLLVRSMEGPWGTGSKQAVDFIFNEKVWAIIGSHDGRNAHLVEQACAKTQTIFLSAWSGDPTLSQAFVPWYFSCVPNDRQQAEALFEEIYNQRKITRVALVANNGYDSKLALKIAVKTSKKLNKPAVTEFFYDDLSKNFSGLVNKIEKNNPEAIVLLGQPVSSVKILQEIKQRKMKQPVFGNILLQGETFVLKKYENLVLISSGNKTSLKWLNFKKEFQKKAGKTPGAMAAYAFDGMNVLIEAIKTCNFDRSNLKTSLANLRFNGVTGSFSFDNKGNRIGKIELVKIKNGTPFQLKK